MKLIQLKCGEADLLMGHERDDADHNDKWAILSVRHGNHCVGEFDLWDHMEGPMTPVVVDIPFPVIPDVAVGK